MIRFENVTKIYKTSDKATEVAALSDVSLEIKKGEFVGIVGRSGCGKSTLINIAGTLDSPTDGKVYFDNKNIFTLTEPERAEFRNKTIGFIFQSFFLDRCFNVLENVTLPLMLKGIKKKERSVIGMEMLKKFGVSDKAKTMPNELSGGEMQRVAICRALINNPKLILADEPTGNLDSQNGKIVIDTLKQLVNEGATVMLVTHNENDAKICDRIIKLNDGRIVGNIDAAE